MLVGRTLNKSGRRSIYASLIKASMLPGEEIIKAAEGGDEPALALCKAADINATDSVEGDDA